MFPPTADTASTIRRDGPEVVWEEAMSEAAYAVPPTVWEEGSVGPNEPRLDPEPHRSSIARKGDAALSVPSDPRLKR